MDDEKMRIQISKQEAVSLSCTPFYAIGIILLVCFIVIRVLYHYQIEMLSRGLTITLQSNTSYIDYSTKYNINFVELITNNITNDNIKCSPNTFKYIDILINELNKNIANISKYTSLAIDKHIVSMHENSINKLNYLRLKSLNGTLYVDIKLSKLRNKNKYMWIIHKYTLNYFNNLFRQYGKYVQNTDFVLFMHNGAHKNFNYNKFPYFISDGSIEYDYIPLFSVPRSYLRLKQSKEYGYNYDQVLKYNNYSFRHKINKLLFRGSITGLNEYNFTNTNWKITNRGALIISLNNNDNISSFIDIKISDKYNISCKKIGIYNFIELNKYCGNFIEIKDQIKYKYILVIDGNSVRDSFPFNLGYQSVIFKQDSNLKEFWYYNLIEDYHYILWNDIEDLKNKLLKVETMDNSKLFNIAKNGRKFVDEYLTDNNMDCFMIHMLQIYNSFFFKSTELELSQNDQTVQSLLNSSQ